MPLFTLNLSYDVEADTPDQAANLLADFMTEGLFYRPVVDVFDARQNFVDRIDTDDTAVAFDVVIENKDAYRADPLEPE